MINYIWPLALVVLSNIFYQICAKSVPDNMNAFASLTVTYLVAASASIVLYFIFGKSGNFIGEISKTNWAPFALGIVIIGLEVGYIFAYKVGWQISTAAIVQGSILAVALIFVGYFAYKEQLTWNKVLGVGICMIGLFFINYQKA